MKIYKAAIISLGPSGLAVNKILYGDSYNEIIAFESEDINKRDNIFGFWLTDWMKPFEKIIEKKWYKWTIGNKNTEVTHTSLDKPYCVISFKTWKKFCLETKNKLEIINKQVVQYFPEQNYFKIITADDKIYYAENIYDSRSAKEKKGELLQHFFGINITVADNTFNEDKLTLMHFTEENNISTVFLNGEIDMDVTDKAKDVILPLIEAGKEVHINLKDVEYMDSSGISVLIESHQKAMELGTKVTLKEISKSVLKVIMMAKLEQILNLD